MVINPENIMLNTGDKDVKNHINFAMLVVKQEIYAHKCRNAAIIFNQLKNVIVHNFKVYKYNCKIQKRNRSNHIVDQPRNNIEEIINDYIEHVEIPM